jgi:hypothetical protein
MNAILAVVARRFACSLSCTNTVGFDSVAMGAGTSFARHWEADRRSFAVVCRETERAARA